MHPWKSNPAGARSGARRRRAAFAAAAFGLLSLIAAEPAAAQFFGPPELIPGLSPGAVRRMMADRGFRVLAPPFRRGDVYVVDAVDDRDGRQIRIIVGAYEGRILQTFVIARPRQAAPSGRPVAAEDRLPFPGESADTGDGRGRRGRGPRQEGGLFGFFSRPADPSDRPAPREPSVVPGIGPQESARPRRVARPKPAAPKTMARGAAVPLPGPKTIPAIADTKAVDQIKPAPARAIAPPTPKPVLPPGPVVKHEALPAPVVKREAPPVPVAKHEAPSSDVGATPRQADIGPRVRPVERSAPTSPAAPSKPKEGQVRAEPKAAADAAPAKPSPAKKRSGPLNDIPPAPLD